MARVTPLMLAVIALTAAHAADVPNPYAPSDGMVIGSAPDGLSHR